MKTPDQQAKEVEEQNKELVDRTINIPLTFKQINIITDIKKQQAALSKRYNKLTKQEKDLIEFVTDFQNIDSNNIEQIGLEGNNLVIIMKPVEKEVSKEDLLSAKTASNIAVNEVNNTEVLTKVHDAQIHTHQKSNHK